MTKGPWKFRGLTDRAVSEDYDETFQALLPAESGSAASRPPYLQKRSLFYRASHARNVPTAAIAMPVEEPSTASGADAQQLLRKYALSPD